MEKSAASQHLLLYDGECGLCDKVVQWVFMHDAHKQFCFAPLQGLTAAPFLKQLNQKEIGDSVILIENFRLPSARLFVRSQAVWRVCLHLGGLLAPFGFLSYLPGWLFDWEYRLVALTRYRLFGRIACKLPPQDSEMFLP